MLNGAAERVLRLKTSLGVWNQVLRYLTRQESIEMQLGDKFFYEVGLGRSIT